ncbi:hypothetical protein AaE_013128 [Aphanomyces astaci]|uniref:RING-type domain-containing protein n=1 Tax=Aphanomyces astaci TaxID=112090 RepID=A0A6A4ZDQ3_APHAT|nr:hypothetical protein AaE_013128 [Aphanomyces astaci]
MFQRQNPSKNNHRKLLGHILGAAGDSNEGQTGGTHIVTMQRLLGISINMLRGSATDAPAAGVEGLPIEDDDMGQSTNQDDTSVVAPGTAVDGGPTRERRPSIRPTALPPPLEKTTADAANPQANLKARIMQIQTNKSLTPKEKADGMQKGLGVDYFHCDKCNACMSITLKKHKCVERSLESDCPICHVYMFTSTTPVMFLPCGHCMHVACYEDYTQTNYICPLCSKSLGDMRAYFARIDDLLSHEQMPVEYQDYRSQIYCSDCERKSETKFHFVYHKCQHDECKSYNTKVVKHFKQEGGSLHPPPAPAAGITTAVAGRSGIGRPKKLQSVSIGPKQPRHIGRM